MNLGDYAEAIKTLRQAGDVFTLLGEADTSAAYCLMMVGVIYKEVGDLGQAERAAQAGLAVGRQTRRRASRFRPSACNTWRAFISARETTRPPRRRSSRRCKCCRKHWANRRCSSAAAAGWPRIYIHTGQVCPGRVDAQKRHRCGQGSVRRKQPRGQLCKPVFRRAVFGPAQLRGRRAAARAGLASREKAHGPNHPAVAEILASYAAALRGLGRTDEADRLAAQQKQIEASCVAMRDKLGDLSAQMIAERPTTQRK